MGQLFFSLSVAMGIMVAYGSYVRDDANLVKSINQIEIFDTLVAFLAGVMIIPAVYTFMGTEGMQASGPSLMFISLPKVFAAMGSIGNVVGCLFFAMVLFADLPVRFRYGGSCCQHYGPVPFIKNESNDYRACDRTCSGYYRMSWL